MVIEQNMGAFGPELPRNKYVIAIFVGLALIVIACFL